MTFVRIRLLVVLTIIIQPITWADSSTRGMQKAYFEYPTYIRRHYINIEIPSYTIRLEGSPIQILKFAGWLDEIASIPYGKEVLEEISSSGNSVTIRHSEWALLASGRTLAPVSSNLINGVGEDVVILFDARIPEQGSHRVRSSGKQFIEFTAVQNLFHELAHANHMCNGTWRYFDSEWQAIEEENIFRLQLGALNGIQDVPIRNGINGLQTWWPGSAGMEQANPTYLN